MTIDPINHKGLNKEDDNDEFLYAEIGKLFIGTSASAPVLSGAIAVLLEAYPNLTREEVFEILQKSSDKIGTHSYDMQANGTSRNDYYGYGKLNLAKAFDLAKNY
jgi:subtilisin family serine protease